MEHGTFVIKPIHWGKPARFGFRAGQARRRMLPQSPEGLVQDDEAGLVGGLP